MIWDFWIYLCTYANISWFHFFLSIPPSCLVHMCVTVRVFVVILVITIIIMTMIMMMMVVIITTSGNDNKTIIVIRIVNITIFPIIIMIIIIIIIVIFIITIMIIMNRRIIRIRINNRTSNILSSISTNSIIIYRTSIAISKSLSPSM